MTHDPGIADATSQSAEPPSDGQEPREPGQDWLDSLATDDGERRRLVRELVMRALV